MLANDFVFHIRNAPPGDLAAVLATLKKNPDLSTIAAIVDHAERMGFVIQDHQRLEALITARDLGLVCQNRNILTDQGEIVTQLELQKSDLFIDVIHGLIFTEWDSSSSGTHCFSWSYRALCKLLWEGDSRKLPGRRELASDIETRARNNFSQPDIAFSSKSVGGALLWLSELTPPVLNKEGTRFFRRTFCSPELFTLAVDFVYQDQQIDYGVNLLLSNENRDSICEVCLLEPESLDRVLGYAEAQFDYLHKGIGGGWGQFLVLNRPPKMKEFL